MSNLKMGFSIAERVKMDFHFSDILINLDQSNSCLSGHIRSILLSLKIPAQGRMLRGPTTIGTVMNTKL